MKGLRPLGWKIHDHLKQHRPKMFKSLETSGQLMPTLLRMQSHALDHLDQLESAGQDPNQAWDQVMREDVFLPTEDDLPNFGETMQPYQDTTKEES